MSGRSDREQRRHGRRSRLNRRFSGSPMHRKQLNEREQPNQTSAVSVRGSTRAVNAPPGFRRLEWNERVWPGDYVALIDMGEVKQLRPIRVEGE